VDKRHAVRVYTTPDTAVSYRIDYTTVCFMTHDCRRSQKLWTIPTASWVLFEVEDASNCLDYRDEMMRILLTRSTSTTALRVQTIRAGGRARRERHLSSKPAPAWELTSSVSGISRTLGTRPAITHEGQVGFLADRTYSNGRAYGTSCLSPSVTDVLWICGYGCESDRTKVVINH